MKKLYIILSMALILCFMASCQDKEAMAELAFPDLNLTIEDLVAKGDKVVVRFIARGTHKGEFMGIPATGIKTVAGAIEIVRIEDRKIVEHWEISDMLSIMQQLGMEL